MYKCSKSFTAQTGTTYYFGTTITQSEYHTLGYYDRLNFVLTTNPEEDYRKRRDEEYNSILYNNITNDSSSNYTDYTSNDTSDNYDSSSSDSSSFDYGGGSDGGGGSTGDW